MTRVLALICFNFALKTCLYKIPVRFVTGTERIHHHQSCRSGIFDITGYQAISRSKIAKIGRSAEIERPGNIFPFQVQVKK